MNYPCKPGFPENRDKDKRHSPGEFKPVEFRTFGGPEGEHCKRAIQRDAMSVVTYFQDSSAQRARSGVMAILPSETEVLFFRKLSFGASPFGERTGVRTFRGR